MNARPFKRRREENAELAEGQEAVFAEGEHPLVPHRPKCVLPTPLTARGSSSRAAATTPADWWYRVPAAGSCDLESIERCCIHRIDTLRNAAKFKTPPRETPSEPAGGGALRDADDGVGHWMLRLAAGLSNEGVRWWVDTETELFGRRVDSAVENGDTQALVRMIQGSRLRYTMCQYQPFDAYGRAVNTFVPVPCDSEQESAVALAKIWVADETVRAEADDMPFAMGVGFELIPTLLRRRDNDVILSGGAAHVLRARWSHAFKAHFRQTLQGEVVVTGRLLPTLLETEVDRLGPVLRALAHTLEREAVASAGTTWRPPAGGVGPLFLPRAELDDRAATLFPPCMAAIIHDLRKSHHLKHESRLLLTLFLKRAGMTIDDQTALYEEEYLKVMTRDVFDKKRYVYSIRHLYGLEGKRHDREPYSCRQIAKDYRSKCPFVGWDDDSAAGLVRRLRPGVDEATLQSVLELKRNGHYRAACGLTPPAERGEDRDDPVTYETPNTYYEAAVYSAALNS